MPSLSRPGGPATSGILYAAPSSRCDHAALALLVVLATVVFCRWVTRLWKRQLGSAALASCSARVP